MKKYIWCEVYQKLIEIIDMIIVNEEIAHTKISNFD